MSRFHGLVDMTFVSLRAFKGWGLAISASSKYPCLVNGLEIDKSKLLVCGRISLLLDSMLCDFLLM